MGTITAADVNKLRQLTGAGMMDCKKALVEADGDFEKAIEILRKKGQKVAANRADRVSAEGAVIAKVNAARTTGIIISLNCETDFVAKNEGYVTLAHELAETALNYPTLETFSAADFKGIAVSEKLLEQTGVIGEKIEIGAFKPLHAPFVGSYIHFGNKIATLVGLSHAIPESEAVAKEIAMQVAAMNPLALNENEVSTSVIEKELEIAKEQLRAEGKPEAMLDSIAKGKLSRFFKDNTLLNQDFIKDSKLSVAAYLRSVNPQLTVIAFERVALG